MKRFMSGFPFSNTNKTIKNMKEKSVKCEIFGKVYWVKTRYFGNKTRPAIIIGETTTHYKVLFVTSVKKNDRIFVELSLFYELQTLKGFITLKPTLVPKNRLKNKFEDENLVISNKLLLILAGYEIFN